MKNTIRIKNKTLVLTVTFVLLIFGAVTAAGGDYLFYQGQKALEADDRARALAYFDQLWNQHPDHRLAPEALLITAQMLPPEDDFYAVLFADFSIVSRAYGSSDLKAAVVGKTERYQHLYDAYPDFERRHLVVTALALIKYEQGDEKAENLLAEALEYPGSPRTAEVGFALVELHLAAQRFGKAAEVLDLLEQEVPGQLAVQRTIYRGHLLTAMGMPEEAELYYERALEKQRLLLTDLAADPAAGFRAADIERSVDYLAEDIARERRHWAASEEAEMTDYAWIEGSVTKLAEPLAGIPVVAQLADDGQRAGGPWETYQFRTVTDEIGRFRIHVPGDTSLRVGLYLSASDARAVDGTHLQIQNGLVAAPVGETVAVDFRFVEPIRLEQLPSTWSQDDGPLDVSWLPWEGAAAYQVNVRLQRGDDARATTRTLVTLTADGPLLRIDPEQIRWPAFGSAAFGPDGIDPLQFLGTWKTGGELQLEVAAVDSNGRVLSSTGLSLFEPQHPASVPLTPEEVSAVEQLFLDHRYDEAVSALTEELENDPDNADILYVLARVRFSGTQLTDDPTEPPKHQNWVKSWEYLQRLITVEPLASYKEELQLLETAMAHRGMDVPE